MVFFCIYVFIFQHLIERVAQAVRSSAQYPDIVEVAGFSLGRRCLELAFAAAEDEIEDQAKGRYRRGHLKHQRP